VEASLSSELAAQIESSRAAAGRAEAAEARLEATEAARAALEAELQLKRSRLSELEATTAASAASAAAAAAAASEEQRPCSTSEAAQLAEEIASLREITQQQESQIGTL